MRSTRRRQDAPDLPRLPVDGRTVGRTYRTPSGTSYRPSLFLTLTLDSYGPVHTIPKSGRCSCGTVHAEGDPLLGVPVEPATYDYRRAARDALHFPKLLDRFWQNLRRAAGWQVQYFGAVELQKRLAPHAHFAVRGTLPRALLRQVTAATYHQLWWPAHDQPVYVDGQLPVWDEQAGGFVDPDTGVPLPTWQQALDQADHDPAASPAHVVRFGRQLDIQGVLAGSPQAGRRIGYLAKYTTKQAADCHTPAGDAAREHLDRLWQHIRVTPCAPTCANWLRYGIQPAHARSTLRAGHCRSRAHRRDTLGMAGRRVLVSRRWSGKTLADHRHDRRTHVRDVLQAAGQDDDLSAPRPTTPTGAGTCGNSPPPTTGTCHPAPTYSCGCSPNDNAGGRPTSRPSPPSPPKPPCRRPESRKGGLRWRSCAHGRGG